MHQGEEMKKTLVALVMASGMVLGSTVVASAATTAPSIKKPSATTEGTGTHEMSETSKTQKVEGVAFAKKKIIKKSAKKKPIKKTIKKKK
jgi:hypothetical protein